MSLNVSKNSPSDSSRSPGAKSSVKRERRRGSKVVPKDAVLIPNVPQEDYFSDVTGVYYHFKKMEWRTICKDPFKNSKRWQKTFGINKYGFYEAKRLAEMKAHEVSETNQLSKILSRYGPLQDDPNLKTHYFTLLPRSGPRFNISNGDSIFNMSFNDTPPSGKSNELHGSFSRLSETNSNGRYLPGVTPQTYKLNSICYRHPFVTVPNSKVNNNIFANMPSIPYRLVSLTTPNRLKNSDFN
ncbi:hypothetical protein MACK_003484 [Theileria orientalis]|uniref:AP2/ERF domain-containing protein n=1 Tax=Theileria orientalis TaxID=68886 RepID=A0A976SJ80_THEOR|nr:hypothetical protein MACK_003484 [Theileria orientalis]